MSCLNSGHWHQLMRQEAEEAAERSAVSAHMHKAADTAGVAQGGGWVVAVDGAAGAAKATVSGALPHHKHLNVEADYSPYIYIT